MRRARSYEDFLGDFRAFNTNNDRFRSSYQTPVDDEIAEYAHHSNIPSSIQSHPRLKAMAPPESSSAKAIQDTKHLVVPFAKIALDYYNTMENVDFKLVEVTGVGLELLPNTTIHVNFKAESNSGKSGMFYAELKTRYLNKVDAKGIQIRGCSMLKKVDSGNPLGCGCSICGDRVIHPGPRDGYTVVAGDRFKDSSFWLYTPSMGLNSDMIRQHTAKYMDTYTVCAKKALEHLNRKLVADWKLLEVVAGTYRVLRSWKKVIHVNFRAESSSFNTSKIGFAELFLPVFDGYSPEHWIKEKEPFLEISGCCLMEKDVDYESKLGRVCIVCTEGLIHPGPRYGYRAIAGDDFAQHDFSSCGNGFFCELKHLSLAS